MSFPLAMICMIACHGGPADHFATFAEELSLQGHHVQIFATGPALQKFQERGLESVSAFVLEGVGAAEEDLLADRLAEACSGATHVFTDVGHPFDVKLQNSLSTLATNVTRLAYYDNPEAYVPGGYSATAAKVMKSAQGILFANANLADSAIYNEPGKEVEFGDRKRIGIGYYPLSLARKVAVRRNHERESIRAEFLSRHGIVDVGQKILVYFGGNNQEYFAKAFPAFLSILDRASHITDLEKFVIVVQQHPGAKSRNIDGQYLSKWLSETQRPPEIFISDYSSDDIQVLADAAFYYQTSMGPQFILSGIPTVQVGHETYEDILVRSHLALSVTDEIQFVCAIKKLASVQSDLILNGLGLRQDWSEILKGSLF